MSTVLLVLYYSTSHALVLAGLFAAILRWRNSRQPADLYFFCLLCGLALSTASMSASFFLHLLPDPFLAVLPVLNILAVLGMPITTAAVSALAAQLSGHPSLVWTAPLAYAIAVFLALATAALLATFPDIFWTWLPGIMGACTLLAVANALLMMRSFPREAQKEGTRWPLIIKGLAVTGLVGLPLVVICDVINLPLALFGFGLPVKFVPLLTAGISALYLAASLGPAPKNPAAFLHDSEDFLLDGYELTPRETEVAKLLLQGESYKEIAARLNIAVSTAKSHVLRVYEKTGASNKMELVRFTRNPTSRH